MGDYFSYPYSGGAFVQWGASHLGALLVIALLAVGMPALSPQRLPGGERLRRAARSGLAFLLLGNELFWHAWHAHFDLWTVKSLLPLNLCNLLVFLSVYALLTRSQLAYEFIYLLGIPAASQVLLTPALGPFGFPHSLFFQIFISHGGVVLAALYLTWVEGLRPASWRSVGRVAAIALLYAAAIFFVNPLLGGNYLFLAYKPPAATLLDLLGPWPWYGLSMAGIGLALVALMYLPFAIQDHGEKKN
jgi:hypothetical integral membrane protein (TIGR02206 family)